MSFPFKSIHLGRYKDLARLLFKYGRADAVRHAGLSELLPQVSADDREAVELSRDLSADVQKLGPTYIKLGQLLSTRPDIVPPAYAEALAQLQDDCEPVPFAEIEQVIFEELEVRASQAFAFIDPVPLATASMAQVHRARLHVGREIALKVQRPGVREQVMQELEALGDIAAFLHVHTELERISVDRMFAEFKKSLLRELDFRQEAMHMLTISANLRDIPEIVIPQPVLGYSSARVLAMDLVNGTKVTELSPSARLSLDGDKLADALFQAYLKQMLRDGLFHADPHPGNVFIADGRVVLIDLGMIARLAPDLQDRLLQLLLAVSDNRPDTAAQVLRGLAPPRDDADLAGFQRAVADIIGQHHEMAFQPPQAGRAVLMLLKAGSDNGVRLPVELAMVGKTLLNLDEIGHALSPHFDPNAAIRRHAAKITEQQLSRDISLSSLVGTAVEVKNFVQHLPGKLSRILDRFADNQFEIKVDAIDETALMEGMQKVANRITLGLVLAALIVGAALMMDIPTSFVLFGYPGLAILLFLGAAAGGVVLAVVILTNDIKRRRKARI
jgi:ubiquinone biosynthesis protein